MIFKRIRDIALAGVHNTLDNLEEPISLLNQYLRDTEEEIAKAEQTIAQQMVLEKRHAALLAETKTQIHKRTRQAELAVDTEQDDIAKLAIQDKLLLESKLGLYEEQFETIKTHTEVLTQQLRTLQEKYSEMQAKKRYLTARVQAAETQKSMSDALRSIDTSRAARGFERMEERVLLMEANAEASHIVLANHRKLDDTVSVEVEEELAKLKAARAK